VPTYPATAAVAPTSGPADTLAAVDEILNQTLSGSLAYNAPESMQLGETLVIELLLNPSLSEEEWGEQIEESGAVVTGTVQITPLTKAELKAQEEAFDILPLNDTPEQPISATESTRWQWQVIAKKEGTQRLTLVVYMLVKYNDQDYWREVETYRNDILVNVTFAQRLRAFDWKWLVGLLVTSGLVPFAWRWMKKRLPRKPSPPSAERTQRGR
ncbi:MAG: hypothetical protein AB1750_14790, partial [Chloroflexota bacterium]